MKVLNLVEVSENKLNAFKDEFEGIELVSMHRSDDYAGELASAEVLFGNIPAAQIEAAPALKWVQILSSGIDEYISLSDSPVKITTAKGKHWMPIAECLVYAIMYFVKNQSLFRRAQDNRQWHRVPNDMGTLKDQRICIIGYGGIGSTLTSCLKPFGPEMVGVSLHPEKHSRELIPVFGLEMMEEMVAISDHIVLALPLTEKSTHIVSRDLLSKFREGAILYNVSRGALVDQEALVEQLQNGKLGGAYLDVFEVEPLPAENPLWQMENVLITPHLSGHYAGLKDDLFDLFKENLRLYLQNRELINAAQFYKD